MRNFLDRIRYQFRDCYGVDKLTSFILIVSVILSFIGNRYIELVAFALLAYAIFRTISKNKYKRYQELETFNNFFNIIKRKYYAEKYAFSQRKEYKIVKCPNCSQKLRLPRKKGRVTITCSKCGNQFKAKS
ncbi:replication restart DNA helicase PriA [Clostridium pasteurianum DSM 525 = ATCC 6013]|uniref:Replication restart DNA helicase PriA n=1 Tax=Clostridium pasteurianum DSM 525 = ATCC 6013 TaxID=1262449 RepID=A0A0H3JB81_CLOPA|nr:hypothetical protein [Clostridium pasteurianum]AJA49270.1 replication restart DNA helicase PriA [Clostridium pasteurianum DSM 525 = ATCC 6013]AJA53258.1 replication restart DNA helicase PriA [Clostridium pasteurianum DSM 525 = ATCC 6013]AOZ76448.1 hypothetical protein AQ983_15550 [Clostridium pasteurianum DSM 525 = ATCC 6013]AOZ80245.1 hypothetical protein AQ984_15545 [Clostridium pasteurianum]ELP58290.1 zinc finger containing protein [Clostridium pasteurianum DSM 525 = ATCC 6013]